MICPNCRNTVPDDIGFCPVCGAALRRPAPNAPGYGYGAAPQQPPAQYGRGYAPQPSAQYGPGYAPQQPVQYNPYGYAPQQPAPYGPGYVYAPQTAPAYVLPPQASTAQTCGIIGMILALLWGPSILIPAIRVIILTLGPISSLVLSIVAISSANRSRSFTGGEYCQPAKVGRVCGTIGLICTLLTILLVALVLIFGIVLLGEAFGYMQW